MNGTWDCIVIGAGAAGLSAALVLGRARRRTLLVDAGEQSNLAAEGVGGFLGADGMAPAAFYERSRAGLEKYPAVSFRAGSIVDGRDTGDGFELTTADGELVSARCILLATGMDYRAPRVPGIDERWGRSVFHCPFCHGWEVREGALGVLDSGESGVHRALLLRSWSDDVTLYTNGNGVDGGSTPMEALDAAGVSVDDRQVLELSGEGDGLAAIRFRDGSERPLRRVARAGHAAPAIGAGDAVGRDARRADPARRRCGRLDGIGATTVPGLFAAGDMNGRMPSVANAVASGSNAAAAIVQRLTAQPPSS